MRLLFFILLLSLHQVVIARQPLVKHQWLNETNTSVRVNDLLQGNDGYVWLGTDQGLYRYNGTVFHKIYDNRINGVTALAIWNNRLTVAMKNGNLAQIQNDTLVPLKINGYSSKSIIHQIAVDKEGRLWLATETGIVQVTRNGTAIYNTDNGLSDDFIYSIDFITSDKLIAATDRGINHIEFSKAKLSHIHTVSTQNGLPDNIVRVVKRIKGTDQFIAGTMDGGICLYNAKENKVSTIKSDIQWTFGEINDLLVIDNFRIIAATGKGYIVNILLNKNGDAKYEPLYLTDRKCYKLLQDISGNILCATSSGISQLTTEYLEQIILAPPFSLSNITAMVCSNDSKLWLALQDSLYYLDLTSGTDRLMLARIFPAPVSSLHIDKYNTVWAGTLGGGIYYKSISGNFTKVAITELKEESVLSISSDTGGIWIAGLNGVKEILYPDSKGKTQIIQQHNKSSGLGSDYVYQLYADSKGAMWMATDGGGIRAYKDGKYLSWPLFNSAENDVAYSICEDAAHKMWAGLLYKDLYRLDKDRWINVRAEKRDIDAGITTIKANATGNVVCVYKKCIDLWYPGSKQFRHFNSRQGLNIDSTSIVLNCGATDKEGNVYIPFQKGILVFKNQYHPFDIIPRMHITSIRNYAGNISNEKSTFAPEDNYINFAFEGISFANAERLNYRYKMAGYNEEWIYTREMTATFAKLPPGYYRFIVQVSLNNDFTNAPEDSFTFRIDKPLWQKAWFITALVIGLGLVVYAYIRYREKNLKRVSQLEQERILFEYEHLKSQINPHFLFNSLNTLASLIEEQPEVAVTYTTNLSDVYRELLIHRDKRLIPLETECEILGAYLHIQKSRFGNALVINTDIPEELMLSKKIVPIALQLLVENAIKHNVVSVAHPLYITIVATKENIKIINTIKPKLTPVVSSGIGLANIKRRYGLITDRQVSYGPVEDKWIVTLPLL